MNDRCPFCGAESTGCILSYGCGTYANNFPLNCKGNIMWYQHEDCIENMHQNKKINRVDRRDCPNCGTRMESKFDLPDQTDWDDPPSVYQCPKCKNIELI